MRQRHKAKCMYLVREKEELIHARFELWRVTWAWSLYVFPISFSYKKFFSVMIILKLFPGKLF